MGSGCSCLWILSVVYEFYFCMSTHDKHQCKWAQNSSLPFYPYYIKVYFGYVSLKWDDLKAVTLKLDYLAQGLQSP